MMGRQGAIVTAPGADYRFAGDGALAILVNAGDSAIFTRTSLTGFSVQACVT
jgi:hypothetical protein